MLQSASLPRGGECLAGAKRRSLKRAAMVGPNHPKSPSSGPSSSGTTRRTALGLLLGTPLLSACSSVQQSLSQFSSPFGSSSQPAAPAGPQQQATTAGTGGVKVGLILPLSASGNAGLAAQSMRNA